ncbi:MAG: molybdopterin-dependent oxidoreductase [Acidobacteria bacterium]|nr:molybdopterin-dependent oxidoreductase [Acidobacteriota bacterium]MYJ25237.1 molybdopterin-dependent oxidoreductase [Holophagales bacterium]
MEPGSGQPIQSKQTPPWEPTACILCENNCGIEVQLGGDDRRQFARLRGDRANPVSKGYVCQKAGRLNHYQNSRDRVLSPLRRCPDGSFEEIDWDTAVREVTARLGEVRDRFGGESIFYYGGGGQGNHLPGFYARSTLRTLGSVYRSNALAQEKTGEMWVAQQMVGAPSRGDFHRCEVGIFLGKNPWQSHGIPRARVTLRELSKDPERCLIVIDVRRSETADLADIFLQVKPGTDAWLLAAMLGVLLEEDLTDADFIARHTDGFEDVRPWLERIEVAAACAACGVPEEQVRLATRRIATASSVAVFEDLGVQMNRHSTLVSYLQRLIWMLTGNFAKTGAQNVSTSLVPITASRSAGPRETPVTGAPVIAGLVPCNAIAEEIVTDHPKRFRAMIVESANPAHSLADSRAMREALRALECVVVIDIAMTETARLADYVLPATTQYEKAEAVFFNFEFPENAFFLRRALLPPPATDKAGPLPEPEIHCRLTEALGGFSAALVEELRTALQEGGRATFAAAFKAAMREYPRLAGTAPALLYRTLGETLPESARSGAALWSAAQICARRFADSVRRAGIEGDDNELGDALFDAIIDSPQGLVFSVDPPEVSWERVQTANGRLQLAIPDLFEAIDELAAMDGPAITSEAFPFVLSAGERRSYTANTIYRDPRWRRKALEEALALSPNDAATLEIGDGELVRLVTSQGATQVLAAISDRMQDGHISLPNGLGLDYPDDAGHRTLDGVAPNELTAATDRDPIAGTPWHKSVPARLERISNAR